MKKAVIALLIAVVVVAGYLFMTGYRLTPEAAARANPFIGRDGGILVLKTNASIGETFVFKVKDYYVTTAPYRRGFLWRAGGASSTEFLDDKNDPVRTLGWISISGDSQYGTVMVIQSGDTRVAAIKVGTNYAGFNERGIAILDLEKPLMPVPSDISAIDSEGKALYIYGDNDGKDNTTDLTKTKWYEA